MAVAAGLAAAGCDDLPSGGHSGDTDTAPCLGPCDETGTPPPITTNSATQVGSEGFWGCPVERVEPIVDPTKEEPLLGGAPSAVIAPYLGAWPILVEDLAVPGSSTPGELGLTAGDVWRWVDVTDGPDCVDHAVVSAQGSLTRASGSPLAMVGAVALRPDGVAAFEATAPRELLGPEWTVPSSTAPWFRVEGPLAPTSLQAAAAWADCPATEPTCDGQEPFATVTGAR